MEQASTRWYSQLYVQVLIGIVIGGAIGFFLPDIGAKLQPFADGFIKLIKMLLAPIIFGTVVVGIAKMGSVKEVGRIGAKALIYFEVLSTLALVIGLVVVNILKPGVGMNIDVNTINGSAITGYAQAAAAQGGVVEFFMNIIPTTLFDAFAKGTETLARAIAESDAFSIAGGGDTLAAIAKYGIEGDVGYISTGGGAFLEVLEGKTLPAFEILAKRAAG